jgi:hypothetical protein
MLKYVQLPTVVLISILTALAITNPSKRDYAKHLVWTFQTTTCQQEQRSIALQAACSTILLMPTDVATDVIAEYSHRRNFIFFSLYNTNFLGLENRSIGAGQIFWTATTTPRAWSVPIGAANDLSNSSLANASH